MFLLKPSALNTRIFTYCPAVAAKKTGIIVHAVVVLSNHNHAVITDPEGRLPEFMAHLHKLVARCVKLPLRAQED